MTALSSPYAAPAADQPIDWPSALAVLRDAGARIHHLGPDTSLPEALLLIAETAVRLVALRADRSDRANAVIYTYDTARAAFDPASRVAAGEGIEPLLGDTPRPTGMGATALARRERVLSYEEHTLKFHPLKFQAGIRTSACYPLLVAGQPVGALYIALHSDRVFTPEELLLLDTFVHLAAVAIYNTRQYEGLTRALERKVDELERLQQADRLISSRRNLDETLQEILKSALNLSGGEHGSFRLVDRREAVLRLRALMGTAGQPTAPDTLPINADSGVVAWVARERQPARIDDLHEPPWSHIYRPLTGDEQMRSELAVPLLGSGGGLMGVLNVESPRLAAFDAEAQSVLSALATQATIAIQEAELLDTIEDITERLAAHAPDAVFALLLERACHLLNAPQAAMWELDRGDPESLVLRAYHGDFPAGYRVAVATSLLGSAVLTGRPVVADDLASDPRLGQRTLADRMGWAAALVVPLSIRNGQPRGALAVYTPEPRTFSDWDTRLLTSLANHAAVSLQLAEALEQVKLAEERQAVAETFAVLGDISANLLHRVNNLVGTIPVKVQALTDKRPELLADGYTAAALRDVEAQARAALEVARETVTYLRPVRLQPTSVEACYQAVRARLHVPREVALTAAGLESLPPVVAGEEQLRLVLFNLIENALDALGDDPGAIQVSGRVAAGPAAAGAVAGWAEITVADSGPGVLPENRERIFDPDFSTKHSLKKLGFGLWWVKTWVQRCGGSIVLASAPAMNTENAQGPIPERGCAFVFKLPLAAGGGA